MAILVLQYYNHLARGNYDRIWLIITYPLIFVRLYWTVITHYKPAINFRAIVLATCVTWCKITGQLSRNNPRFCRYLSSGLFPSENKITALEIQLFISFILHGRKANSFHGVKDIKKVIANAVPERYKKVNKICCQRL